MKFQRKIFVKELSDTAIDIVEMNIKEARDAALLNFDFLHDADHLEVFHYKNENRIRFTVRNRKHKVLFQLKTMLYKNQEIPFEEKK